MWRRLVRLLSLHASRDSDNPTNWVLQRLSGCPRWPYKAYSSIMTTKRKIRKYIHSPRPACRAFECSAYCLNAESIFQVTGGTICDCAQRIAQYFACSDYRTLRAMSYAHSRLKPGIVAENQYRRALSPSRRLGGYHNHIVDHVNR